MRRRSPIPPAEPWHADRPGLERAYRIDPAGVTGPTRGEAGGRFWRTVAPGWYRPIEPAASAPQRIVEASYRLPAYGGVTGWAALCWSGGRWFDGIGANGGDRDVPLAVLAANRAHQPGVLLSKERLRPEDLAQIDGLQTTSLARATLFEMRYASDLLSAVTTLDMACYNDLVSIEEVRGLVAEHSGWTGIPQARAALPLARENAWSPREVLMRWWWEQDGRGPLLCNPPVFDSQGRHLFTPDLLDVRAGVAGEYDGVGHLSRARRNRDIQRENDMRTRGLELITMVADDTEETLRKRLRDTYARAQRTTATSRDWTLDAPEWWRRTETVAQRRALSQRDRERLLANRAA